jgi:hypothetical protein
MFGEAAFEIEGIADIEMVGTGKGLEDVSAMHFLRAIRFAFAKATAQCWLA